jgi:hypothetical protein
VARREATSLAGYTRKRRIAVPGAGTPVPLRAVYLPRWVSPEAPPEASAASAADAVALLACVFRLDIHDRPGLARDFDTAASLVAAGIVRRLAVPRGFERLPDVCAAVRHDVEGD